MSGPRIVIVGAGFAGYRTADVLARAARGRAEITLLNPTDYFLYLPLLPQVAAGVLEPRRVTVSLTGTLPDVRLVLGEAGDIDLDGRTVHYTDPEGGTGTLGYDRLVLAAGSVNKLLPIPGVAEHAHGFRGLAEALYLRDHVTRQIELASAADDPSLCAARCTFVVVGAGYTGTEVAAQGKLFTDALVGSQPLRAGMRPRWMLLDLADRVLPELDQRLSRTADRVLRARGVDVRMGTSVKEATREGVLLSDGESVATRTLVWCVGVRPDPLVEGLGLSLERGRLLVGADLQVPGHPEVFACGDAAAVPDLENPGRYTPMTAQHAWRQGKTAARNVAASLTGGELRDYRHKDLGFVVDLGGTDAAAAPLGVPLSGLPAGLVTRGYHLLAMPGNRVRVAADWLLDAVLPRQAVQLGLVRSWSVPLDTASPESVPAPDDWSRRQRTDGAESPGSDAARPGGTPDSAGPRATGGGGGDDTTRTITSPTPGPVKAEGETGTTRPQPPPDSAATGGGGGDDTSRTITSPTPEPVRHEPERRRRSEDSGSTGSSPTRGQDPSAGSGASPEHSEPASTSEPAPTSAPADQSKPAGRSTPAKKDKPTGKTSAHSDQAHRDPAHRDLAHRDPGQRDPAQRDPTHSDPSQRHTPRDLAQRAGTRRDPASPRAAQKGPGSGKGGPRGGRPPQRSGPEATGDDPTPEQGDQ